MPVIIPEKDKLDFLESVSQAAHDARTEGFFLMLIAPRNDGNVRESSLAVGKLPKEALLQRTMQLCARVLINHNEAAL